MISTVITGAGGRMGQSLIRLLANSATLRLHAAVDAPGSGSIGKDAGRIAGLDANGVMVAEDLAGALRGAQLLIDFSVATATTGHLQLAAEARVAMLIGTTGLDAPTYAAVDSAARRIAVLPSTNTSAGVALLASLVERSARALPDEFNIEIIEVHHKHKRDAPSGTALTLAEAAARGRGGTLESLRAPIDRNANQSRPDAQIGISTVRGGDVVGEHEILFLGPGERLVFRHTATDRSLFARGALQAGAWLVRQAPGRYRMADVFSLKDQ